MHELDEARAEAGIETPDHLTELMGDLLEVAHHEVLPIREQAGVEPRVGDEGIVEGHVGLPDELG